MDHTSSSLVFFPHQTTTRETKKDTMETMFWKVLEMQLQFPHLASMRLSARSSHCSDTVSSSCRRAMALSTELWGARPTPWSISLLMVSRQRLSGRLLACCTASSQRACSSLSLSRGSWGSSTSRPRLTSSSSCSSSGLGDSSERRRSLRCWKSSTRVNRSWEVTLNRHLGTDIWLLEPDFTQKLSKSHQTFRHGESVISVITQKSVKSFICPDLCFK